MCNFPLYNYFLCESMFYDKECEFCYQILTYLEAEVIYEVLTSKSWITTKGIKREKVYNCNLSESKFR